MSAIQHVHDVAEIKPPDPEQVRKWLAAGNEVFPGIFKTPGVLGGKPCIGRRRIAVFMLVEMKQHGVTDASLLYNYPGVTQADLDNAWEYERQHSEEIQNQIDENNRDDDD